MPNLNRLNSSRQTMAAVVFCVLLLPSLASADTIVLKNEARYVGRITSQNDDEVTIVSGGVTWAFKRDKIAQITRNASEVAHDRARTAQNAKKLEKATAVAMRTKPKPTPKKAPIGNPRSSGSGTQADMNTQQGQIQRMEQLVHQPFGF